MFVVVTTIAPIFLIIVAGFFLRRTKLFPADAWPPVERITYYVLFPALLFGSVAHANIDDLPLGPLAIGVIGTPALMALALASPASACQTLPARQRTASATAHAQGHRNPTQQCPW